MTAAPGRRTVLGSILTAGACLAVPSWAGAGALVADPVLAAIERHRRAYDAFMEVWGQTNVSDLYDRANAEEGAAAELRQARRPSCDSSASLRPRRRRHSPPC
jgi:hypothetical protein